MVNRIEISVSVTNDLNLKLQPNRIITSISVMSKKKKNNADLGESQTALGRIYAITPQIPPAITLK